jgi:hypothetical protein
MIVLPPNIVKWITDKFCIDVPPWLLSSGRYVERSAPYYLWDQYELYLFASKYLYLWDLCDLLSPATSIGHPLRKTHFQNVVPLQCQRFSPTQVLCKQNDQRSSEGRRGLNRRSGHSWWCLSLITK